MRAVAFFVGACLLAAGVPVLTTGAHARGGREPSRQDFEAALRVATEVLAGTPLRGRPLTQQAPTGLEERFADRFPGSITRFRAGEATVIVRRVTVATRQLHPAADCFRAAGYTVGVTRARVDSYDVRWRCFEARAGDSRARVCERIADETGRSWTDVSSWYWSALWAQGRGGGPWWAVTLVTPFEGGDRS